MAAPFTIGLIISSTRAVRVGPQIATFITDTLKQHSATQLSSSTTPTIELIDLKDFSLPLFDEPIIPKHIQSTNEYHHAHTKAWSARISKLHGFIFLLSQRNWGIPAELKNAIDYLYYEWYGKPCGIVSYGGRGGEQAAAQLRAVLEGMGLQVEEKMPALAFAEVGRDFMGRAFRGEELGLDAADAEAPWAEKGKEVVEMFEGLVGSLRRGGKAV